MVVSSVCSAVVIVEIGVSVWCIVVSQWLSVGVYTWSSVECSVEERLVLCLLLSSGGCVDGDN